MWSDKKRVNLEMTSDCKTIRERRNWSENNLINPRVITATIIYTGARPCHIHRYDGLSN